MMRNETMAKNLKADILRLEEKKSDTIAAIDAQIAQKKQLLAILEPEAEAPPAAVARKGAA
jgi:hypothetical protein